MKRFFLMFVFSSLILSAADAPPLAPVTNSYILRQKCREVTQHAEFQNLDEDNLDTVLSDECKRWLYQFGKGLDTLQVSPKMQSLISLLSTLFVLLTFAGIIYIIARLFWTRRREYHTPPDQAPEPKSALSPTHYEDEIRQAEEAGNWQNAWLAAWRQFLLRLEQHHLAYQDRSRTNQEYITQVLQHPLPSSVAPLLQDLVKAYDLFVYGQKPLLQNDWLGLRTQLEMVGKLLELDRLRGPRESRQ